MTQPVQQPITSLPQFAQLVAAWFFTKSQQLDQLIEFPEHEPLKITDNITGEEKVLTGAEREAFFDGLKVAATLFDKLPFEWAPVDAAGNPAEEEPSEPQEGTKGPKLVEPEPTAPDAEA
ncbi:hypothetical protein K5F27_16950 [Acinetobacter baumannii]|uniref:hypothetical protein n=1 Tax=Acinetobacter baumannii TaxID=470 RepID=UPI001FF30EEA|nr:hypothetical protein [Acinetobacter baumannii]MCJ9118967.1 hypothetical protein [Acinetobacter baumannii]MCJ9181402.1 hypothetical protein [Acinetobacter baumannii]MCJ9185107.1 hypothetical protein [Acinetobacter baumannii]MCJ9192346.1 hypothetical protein [Acinetobacter baumannii]MCJ9199715.1 hypothetical protein [Acinetobacter baumannii]